MFLIIRCMKQHASQINPFVFSPQVMKWDTNTWIIDLTTCHSYWQYRCYDQGYTQIEDFWRTTLQQYHDHLSCVLTYTHPWKALLLATFMQERQLTGLLTAESQFSQNLLTQISWNTWWQAVDNLAALYSNDPDLKSQITCYKQSKRRLKALIKRLGAAAYKPYDLYRIKATAIARRYGVFFKQVWQWSFVTEQQSNQSFFKLNFPWQPLHAKAPIQLNRYLDSALVSWEQIAHFLQEDFHKLVQLYLGSFELIVSLQWRLFLSHGAHLNIPIQFRHPHLLSSESPHFTTALLQAYYSFEDYYQQKKLQDHFNDDSIQDAITGWQIIVTESLHQQDALLKDFFSSPHTTQQQAIESLENKLRFPLYQFYSRADWTLEGSWAQCLPKSSQNAQATLAYQELFKTRPLFLLKPYSLKRKSHQSASWVFCERHHGKWWEQTDAIKKNYDYYRYTDSSKKQWWIRRHNKGTWQVCGIFS